MLSGFRLVFQANLTHRSCINPFTVILAYELTTDVTSTRCMILLAYTASRFHTDDTYLIGPNPALIADRSPAHAAYIQLNHRFATYLARIFWVSRHIKHNQSGGRGMLKSLPKDQWDVYVEITRNPGNHLSRCTVRSQEMHRPAACTDE